MAFTGPAAEQAVITGLDAARGAEYAEVPGRLPGLHRELAREQARGRAADAGAGEPGGGLDRFRAWLAKIGARDYFGAAGGAAAALAASGNAAPDAGTSGPAPAAGPGRPRLRAAGGP